MDIISLAKQADASKELVKKKKFFHDIVTHIKGGEAVSLAVQTNHTYVYANVPRRTAVAKINSVVGGSVMIVVTN